VSSAAHDAFISAFASSMKVAAGVAVAGVVAAIVLIRSQRQAMAPAPALEPTGEHAPS
jgi:hypothetical protein